MASLALFPLRACAMRGTFVSSATREALRKLGDQLGP